MTGEDLSAHSGDGRGTATPPDRPVDDALALARALHDLTDRYRLVLENVSDVIVQYDAHGRVLWASPSLRTTFGYDDVAAVGTRLRFEHPDDAGSAEAYVKERMRDRSDVIDNHNRVVCADGTVRWATSRTRVVTHASGDLDYIVVTMRDVTDQIEASRALSASEAKFRLMAESSSDFVSLTDAGGTIRWVSSGVTEVLGWEPEDLVGHRGLEFFRPEDAAVTTENLARIAAGETVYSRLQVRHKDGAWVWLAQHMRPVLEDGIITGRVSAWRAAAAEIAAEQALANAEAHFRMLAENSTDVVLHTDAATGLVDWVSPSARWILGYDPDELVGTRVMDLMHPDDLEQVRHLVRELVTSGQATGRTEARIRTADGPWLWMSDSGRAVRDDDGNVLGGIDSLRDISPEHAMREELEQQARRDSLTGLPNRRDLLERLESVLAHEPRAGTVTAVLFLDLDRLKQLNDRYGHRLGDDVIVEVGRRISASLRAGDVVGRLAGDEYVVILSELAAPSDAWLVADAIHDRMRTSIVVGDLHVRVTVSIGLTIARPGERPEDVLHRADVALYRAKDGGRSRTEADVSEDGLAEFGGSVDEDGAVTDPDLPEPRCAPSSTAPHSSASHSTARTVPHDL
jgi:diguanylate cyclase (GGDEF)-like protein/PAS domain S-box-containing protein